MPTTALKRLSAISAYRVGNPSIPLLGGTAAANRQQLANLYRLLPDLAGTPVVFLAVLADSGRWAVEADASSLATIADEPRWSVRPTPGTIEVIPEPGTISL